jgi:hypothetical protein
MIRDWVEAQAAQNQEIQGLLKRFSSDPAERR